MKYRLSPTLIWLFFGANAFQESEIDVFEFPDSPNCTRIPTSMFAKCARLHNLTLSPFISDIGDHAFFFTPLSKFFLPPNQGAFILRDGILFSRDNKTIWSCPPKNPLARFVIPKEVESVKNSAFSEVTFPISFEAGSKLLEIGAHSFSRIRQKALAFDPDCPLVNITDEAFGNSMLETISLPNNVEFVEGSAFSATKITQFEISHEATHLASSDGVLYSKDMKTLFRFPPMKSGDYVVPKSVETIGRSAFTGCCNIVELRFASDSQLTTVDNGAFSSSSIVKVVFPSKGKDVKMGGTCFLSSKVQSVTLPGLMKTIRTSTFQYCSSLKEVILPEFLEKIEPNAFLNCESLTTLEIPKYAPITEIGNDAFAGVRALTEITLPYRLTKLFIHALPANLKHITLYCPPNPSITAALAWLPSLSRVDLICGAELNTTGFSSTDIAITHICDTKRVTLFNRPFRIILIQCLIYYTLGK